MVPDIIKKLGYPASSILLSSNWGYYGDTQGTECTRDKRIRGVPPLHPSIRLQCDFPFVLFINHFPHFPVQMEEEESRGSFVSREPVTKSTKGRAGPKFGPFASPPPSRWTGAKAARWRNKQNSYTGRRPLRSTTRTDQDQDAILV